MSTTKNLSSAAKNGSAQKQETIVAIANPVYDVVFKYLMEDNAAAKLVVSSIIGEKVVHLEPKPQERITEKSEKKKKEDKKGATKVEELPLTIYRLDFSAKIKTPDGHKIVIIEMQKASLPTDIMRFRSYLGKQYSDVSNAVSCDDGTSEPVQIYAIYFLGKDLGICDTPVLSITPEVRDVATQQIVEARSRFIDLLNHKEWVIQISCLKKRRRNDLEQLLSIFDQSNRTSDVHILNVREEDFPEKYRPVIRRLKMAASSTEVKRQMAEEDDVLRYLKDILRGAHHEGREEMKKEMDKLIEEKDQALDENRIALNEKDQALAEKDQALNEKDQALNEKDQALAEKDQTLAEKAQALEAALARIAQLEQNRKNF
jgi:hypothetical protein